MDKLRIFLGSKSRRLQILAVVLGIAGSILVYYGTAQTVKFVIDGKQESIRSHAQTVSAALHAAGYDFTSDDYVWPNPESKLPQNAPVILNHSRTVHVILDGQSHEINCYQPMAANILAKADIKLYPGDSLWIDGLPANNQAASTQNVTRRLRLKRSIAITLSIDGARQIIHSSAATLGEALWEAGISLYAGDKIDPGLKTSLTEPLDVTLKRSRALAITADGSTMSTRVVGDTVGEVLSEAGLPLQGLDYSEPAESEIVPRDGRIKIVRVSEEVLIEQKPLPFDSQFEPDPETEIDQQSVVEEGTYGILANRVRVRYAEGEEVARFEESEWTASDPRPRIIGYGTKVVVRTMDTPDGPIEYWRAVSMYATSYSPCRLGVDYCSYNTAAGATLRKGIVAVLVRWYLDMVWQQVYVPGYGVGTIADTGGGIPGRKWIDLGYEDDDYVSWHNWVTVYFLTPVPEYIPYILN